VTTVKKGALDMQLGMIGLGRASSDFPADGTGINRWKTNRM